MKKLLSIILSITMLLSMGTVAFADGVDGLMQKAKIKVGISADFPPFEYYNENEELCRNSSNFAVAKLGHDVYGKNSETRYYDENEEPTEEINKITD